GRVRHSDRVRIDDRAGPWGGLERNVICALVRTIVRGPHLRCCIRGVLGGGPREEVVLSSSQDLDDPLAELFLCQADSQAVKDLSSSLVVGCTQRLEPSPTEPIERGSHLWRART